MMSTDMTTSHEFITHLFLEMNVQKLKTVLSIVAAAATLTFGLASAQASPDTVAIKDLKLVGEKAAAKTNEHGFSHGGGHGYYGGGHGGGHGYYGGHRGGHGYYGGGHGYYGGHHGGHGYYGGHRGGHGYYGGHHGGHWKSPSDAVLSPKVSL